MPQEMLLAAMIVGAIIVFGALVIVLLLPRGKQVEAMAETGVPFELRCTPRDDKPYRLWARLDVHWRAGGRNGYGIVFDLKVANNDHVIRDQPFGLGHDVPGGVERLTVGSERFVSHRSSPSGYWHTATVQLLDLGPRSRNSEITVSGTVLSGPKTVVSPTKLFIAR